MIPRAPLFFLFLVSFFARLGELRTEGTWPVPSGTPGLFLSFGGDPGCFVGKVMLCGPILLVRIDLPVARFGLFCGSDDLIATFPCSGLLFFVVLITRLRLSLVLVYFSLNFR